MMQARSLLDLREFDRAADRLMAYRRKRHLRGGAVETEVDPTEWPGHEFFLYVYARYLAGERRKEAESCVKAGASPLYRTAPCISESTVL